MDVTFKLQEQEAVGLINVIGQLPTNSGVYPVLVKLVAQFKEQVPQEETKNG